MSAETHHHDAVALMQQGRFADTEQRLEVLLEANPGDVRALRLLDAVCHLTGRAHRTGSPFRIEKVLDGSAATHLRYVRQ